MFMNLKMMLQLVLLCYKQLRSHNQSELSWKPLKHCQSGCKLQQKLPISTAGELLAQNEHVRSNRNDVGFRLML